MDVRRVGRLARGLFGRWEMILIILIGAAVAWCASLSPYFLTAANLASLSGPYVPIGILALGLTLVIIGAEIDISFVSTMVLSASAFGLLWQGGVNVWVAAVLALVVGAALGAVNGVLVAAFELPSLAITLGTLAAYSGLAAVILRPEGITGFPESFTTLGLATVGIWPISLLIFVGAAIAIGVVLHRTRVGRYIYAVGANREAARLSGIPVTAVVISSFAFLGLVAGGAGLIYTAQYSIRSDAGAGALITAVTVVVLGGVDIFGGRGSVFGVVLAFFLVCLLRNGMQLANINSNAQDIVVSSLLIVAILVGRLREGGIRDSLRLVSERMKFGSSEGHV